MNLGQKTRRKSATKIGTCLLGSEMPVLISQLRTAVINGFSSAFFCRFSLLTFPGINTLPSGLCASEVAQWERAGLITLRPSDRNRPSLPGDRGSVEALSLFVDPPRLVSSLLYGVEPRKRFLYHIRFLFGFEFTCSNFTELYY